MTDAGKTKGVEVGAVSNKGPVEQVQPPIATAGWKTSSSSSSTTLGTAALHSVDITNSTASAEVLVLPEVFSQWPEMQTTRRYFHAHPELSFQELKTAAAIVDILKSIGLTEIYEQVGRTGVVAIIRGSSAGPCIALRADIDGLPILETAAVDYCSKNAGVMHACGHDGHITGLLAAVRVLWSERETLKGTVKLLFQPAEEGQPTN